MDKEKIMTIKQAAAYLRLTQQGAIDKAKRLGFLKYNDFWERYYIEKSDLEHFKVDFRAKDHRHLANYPKKYKKRGLKAKLKDDR